MALGKTRQPAGTSGGVKRQSESAFDELDDDNWSAIPGQGGAPFVTLISLHGHSLVRRRSKEVQHYRASARSEDLARGLRIIPHRVGGG